LLLLTSSVQLPPPDDNTNMIICCKIVSEEGHKCLKLSCFDNKKSNPKKADSQLVEIEAIMSILFYVVAKDVLPSDNQIKFIRDFHEFVRLFIFSFIQFNQTASSVDEIIQLRPSTMGLFTKELQIKLFKIPCSVILKHTIDRNFRLSFYTADKEDVSFERGFGIDIKCDLLSYQQLFKDIKIDKILDRHLELDRNLFVQSHHLVDSDQLMKKLRSSKYSLNGLTFVFDGFTFEIKIFL